MGRAGTDKTYEASPIGTTVLANVAAFRHTLREAGMVAGLRESEDAARLLATGLANDPEKVRSAFKSLFCSRRSDWEAFDSLFDAFWLGRGTRTRVRTVGSPPPSGAPSLRDLARQGEGDAGGAELGEVRKQREAAEEGADQDGGRSRMEGASRAALKSRTDFRRIADPDALAEAHALAERLARRMRDRITRRSRPARRAGLIDLRRTIHRNIAHGGVPIELIRRAPKPKPLRLVLLLDASGSMSLYTSLFIRFMHGVLAHFQSADAFLFHTRLVEISHALREKDGTRALERLTLMAEGVGGGTRIGESLATFNRWHAARVLHARSCLIIVSDGYDTGAPEALAAEMARLRRRCRRIVWLNPMLGWTGYEPAARGMQAALPFVDRFAPAHDLASLAALEPYLARI